MTNVFVINMAQIIGWEVGVVGCRIYNPTGKLGPVKGGYVPFLHVERRG